MDTDRLIRTLAENVEPVTPMAPPWRRATLWTCGAGAYLLLLIIVVPARVDPVARLRDIGFLLTQGAAVLTGITAAFAALASSVPGYRRHVVWMPIASVILWVALVAERPVQETQFSLTVLQTDWRCVPATLIGTAMPAAFLVPMLRRGVPTTPRLTLGLAGLAAAGVGNIGICFFQPHNSGLATLVGHCGTVAVVATVAAISGTRLLRWPTPRITLASR